MGLRQQGRQRKWQLTSCNPLGLQDDEDLQALLKGSQLLKVKSNSWRRERFYKLQEDCKTIWQESRKVMRTPESQLCECLRAAGGGVGRVWTLCLCGELDAGWGRGWGWGGQSWTRTTNRDTQVWPVGAQVGHTTRTKYRETKAGKLARMGEKSSLNHQSDY